MYACISQYLSPLVQIDADDAVVYMQTARRIFDINIALLTFAPKNASYISIDLNSPNVKQRNEDGEQW